MNKIISWRIPYFIYVSVLHLFPSDDERYYQNDTSAHLHCDGSHSKNLTDQASNMRYVLPLVAVRMTGEVVNKEIFPARQLWKIESRNGKIVRSIGWTWSYWNQTMYNQWVMQGCKSTQLWAFDDFSPFKQICNNTDKTWMKHETIDAFGERLRVVNYHYWSCSEENLVVLAVFYKCALDSNIIELFLGRL